MLIWEVIFDSQHFLTVREEQNEVALPRNYKFNFSLPLQSVIPQILRNPHRTSQTRLTPVSQTYRGKSTVRMTIKRSFYHQFELFITGTDSWGITWASLSLSASLFPWVVGSFGVSTRKNVLTIEAAVNVYLCTSFKGVLLFDCVLSIN